MKNILLVSIFTLSVTSLAWASDRSDRNNNNSGNNQTELVGAPGAVFGNTVSGNTIATGAAPGNLVLGGNTGNLMSNTNTVSGTNTNTFNPTNTNTVTNTNTNANANTNTNTNTNANANANRNVNRNVNRNTATGGTANVTVNGTSANANPTSDTITIRNTPAVAPPAIYGTNNCALGVSAGFSMPGLGLGGGFSYESQNCEVRAQAALAHTTGQQDVAQEVMCELTAYRQARRRVGRPCASDLPTPHMATPIMPNVPVQSVAVAPAPRNTPLPQFCSVPGLNVASYPECN